MTMTDDLLERLHDGVRFNTANHEYDTDAADADMEEGAKRIEALTADNARLRKLLAEAASDLTAYVNAEYPPDTCAEYPHIAKRHHRDMELVRHIRAALNAGKETK
jgi:hypothetical protein